MTAPNGASDVARYMAARNAIYERELRDDIAPYVDGAYFSLSTPTYKIEALMQTIDALRAELAAAHGEMRAVRDELLSGNQLKAATRMRVWRLED